ncbi:protein F, phosphoribosyltransferase domain [Psychrobacter nivimaris]|uniref:Protein F, phosphoribosyltransferase domain n=1 Tax=Psychrobacter nivimaris TaxID=281738 RepID=A0A6N7C0V7_9GAMM|nr:ComF family protein [Psychrobacter nivimaris]KAF0569769.1 protein F, phosphoribosyltransferase domain [Psychrobacter nivimaris]
MRGLAPYQTGLWLAEYMDMRCQLCRIYRSTPQSQLLRHQAPSSLHNIVDAPPTRTALKKHSFLTNIVHQANSHLSSGLLCAHCHNDITWLPRPFEVDIAPSISLSIQASTYYEYPIRQSIRAFKHQEDMTKLPLLLHAIRQLPRPHGCHRNNSVIVAMPTTSQRLVKRGFDPVSILSAQLSKYWQIPLWQGIKRIDDTVSQQGLSRAERLSNLDNAFALIEKPPTKRLLLFDDVSTTGASLQALARAFISPTAIKSVTDSGHNSYQISAYVLAHGSKS